MISFSNKRIIFFVFLSLFVTGIYFSADFGISWDENWHRKRGKENIAYISRVLGINDILQVPENIKNPQIGVGGYGPIFEIFCILAEKSFSAKDGKAIYELRHKINFSFYFISIIIFYLFLKKFFKSPKIAFIGALFYLLSPRILAHGFFNSKDSIAQAILACAIFPLFLTFKRKSIKMSLIAGVLIGIATTIRLPIIYLPCLFLFFIFITNFFYGSLLEKKTKNFKTSLCFLITTILSIYIFFPELWEAPIKNFLLIFDNLNHHPWTGNNLYLGELFQPSNVPWHYIPVWIIVTTPITFLFFFITGIIKSFLNIISLKTKNNLFHIFMFAGFIVPILAIIFLKAHLYNGWRHLFFIYPYMVFFMVIGFFSIYDWLCSIFSWNNSKILYSLILITFLNPLIFVIKSHPNQQVFFNKFAGSHPLDNFEGDYWAVSMRHALDWIVENDPNESVNVLSVWNVAAKNNRMLEDKHRHKINYFRLSSYPADNNQNNKSPKNNNIEYPTNYFITNSRLEKEGFTPKNKNEVFGVFSANLKLWSVHKTNER